MTRVTEQVWGNNLGSVCGEENLLEYPNSKLATDFLIRMTGRGADITAFFLTRYLL